LNVRRLVILVGEFFRLRLCASKVAHSVLHFG
jgi:hypothetical protein